MESAKPPGNSDHSITMRMDNVSRQIIACENV